MIDSDARYRVEHHVGCYEMFFILRARNDTLNSRMSKHQIVYFRHTDGFIFIGRNEFFSNIFFQYYCEWKRACRERDVESRLDRFFDVVFVKFKDICPRHCDLSACL